MKILVTGAASGIGRAVALQLAGSAAAGSTSELFLVDRDEGNLAEAVADASQAGARASGMVADLADASAPAQIIARAARELGGLDGLVSNAGAIHMGALETIGADEFDRLFNVNARATLLLANAALPMLRQSRGAVVATASLSSEQPTPALGAYSASKAALVMLVRQMALEWGPDGVRCNCVSPGPTYTALTAATYSDPARREKRGLDIPLRRVGMPDDIASAITFLLSPAAAFISGVNLMVDGGMSQTLMVSPNSAAHAVANR